MSASLLSMVPHVIVFLSQVLDAEWGVWVGCEGIDLFIFCCQEVSRVIQPSSENQLDGAGFDVLVLVPEVVGGCQVQLVHVG